MARRQYKRSPHPGVVLTPRKSAAGETTWRARYVDPETGVKVWEKLEHTLSNHEARRVWAIRKAEALSQRRAELKTGARRRTRTPFDDALKDFWTSCRAQLRASTIATYGHGIRLFERWAKKTGVQLTEDLTPPRLRAFREHLIAGSKRKVVKGDKRGARVDSDGRRNPVTINTYMTNTKVLLNHWRALGLTPELSKDTISDALKRLPVPREEAEFLRPGDIALLLRAALRHDRVVYVETRDEHAGLRQKGTTPRYSPIAPLVMFLLLSGCRRGEALGMRWADIDLDAMDHQSRRVGEIRLRAEATKTKHARVIGLEVSPALRRLLAAMKLRAGEGDVFVFGGHERYTHDLIEAARARLMEEFGAPAFTWQVLRSSCATYLTNAPGIWGAATVFLSARQLGHSVAVAERHYLGVHRGIRREARTLEAAMEADEAIRQVVDSVSQGQASRTELRVPG
jgi:integrase